MQAFGTIAPPLADASTGPPRSDPNRPSVARGRARLARAALRHCRLCAHLCGVNRLAGERGLCRAGPEPHYFLAQTELGDELELVPAFNIALSGCDLRCNFCITGASSWNPRAGDNLDIQEVAARAAQAVAEGARTIMLLGGEPTIHLPAALDLVAALPASATLVYKTNAHVSAEARALLDGMFDVWVADFKFGNDHCAKLLAGVNDYLRITRENLLWAANHARLIVRHLLMPGHIDCCWEPIAHWLAANLPGTRLSLRSGFWPAWHSHRHAELWGTTSAAEAGRATAIARDYALTLVR